MPQAFFVVIFFGVETLPQAPFLMDNSGKYWKSVHDGGGHAPGSDKCDLSVHVVWFGSGLVDGMCECSGHAMVRVRGELDVAAKVAKGVARDG